MANTNTSDKEEKHMQ